jgi:hypothetical protein
VTQAEKFYEGASEPLAVLDFEISRRDQTQFRASRAMAAFGKSGRYKGGRSRQGRF